MQANTQQPVSGTGQQKPEKAFAESLKQYSDAELKRMQTELFLKTAERAREGQIDDRVQISRPGLYEGGVPDCDLTVRHSSPWVTLSFR